MHVLFDNGVPRGAASVLKGHVVEEARDRGWDRLTNGDLLRAAEAAGFDVLPDDRSQYSLPAEPVDTRDRRRRPEQRQLAADQEQAVRDRCRR
jgi:hypothetical protein